MGNLFVILGPTGVGKTDISIDLATTLSCSIVSSDSRQIYKEISIGTAKPSEEELNKIVWDEIKQVNTGFPRYKHIQKLITSHTDLIKTSTKKVKRQEEIKLIMESLEKK